MNRKARRATIKRGRLPAGNAVPASAKPDGGQSFEQARQLYRQGRFGEAEQACRAILAREPAHSDCFNLLGIMAQSSGRHSAAVRLFSKAVEASPDNAPSHYNLAVSLQALGRWDRATSHFGSALTLDSDEGLVERLLLQNPAIAGGVQRAMQAWPRPLNKEELLGRAGIAALVGQAYLHCVLKVIALRNPALEILLTRVRFFLLQEVRAQAPAFTALDEKTFAFLCALAQQCFINGYVYSQSDVETRQVDELRNMTCELLARGGIVPPLQLAAVAAYVPLCTLPNARSLLDGDYPAPLSDLLRQQVREPLEERQDSLSIPALTAIDDPVSVRVRQQYEKNPYPRWTVIPHSKLHQQPAGGELRPDEAKPRDILIAGCGTGQHAINVALLYPRARVLAVDISLASLAYARRKTRQAGIANIDYAQADILMLGSLDRRFDRIEAIGVLHHLGDPKAGWRVLLSLLRPDGIMDVALYSEIARRPINAGRRLIARRHYPATADGIRACRQEILRLPERSIEKNLTTLHDFYDTDGCRDLLFNVMEHQFTLPEIKAFLSEQRLTLLRMDVAPEVRERFQREFPGPAALTDLDSWHRFETAHPDIFMGMYRFEVAQFDQRAACSASDR